MLSAHAVKFGGSRNVTEDVQELFLATIIVFAANRAEVFFAPALGINSGAVVQQSFALLEVSCRLLSHAAEVVHVCDTASSVRHQISCQVRIDFASFHEAIAVLGGASSGDAFFATELGSGLVDGCKKSGPISLLRGLSLREELLAGRRHL